MWIMITNESMVVEQVMWEVQKTWLQNQTELSFDWNSTMMSWMIWKKLLNSFLYQLLILHTVQDSLCWTYSYEDLKK